MVAFQFWLSADFSHTEELLAAKIVFSHETCHVAEWGNLHYDCIVVVTCYSVSANPVVWVNFNEHNRLLAAALLHEQNHQW